ncbi:MAG: lytic murein transglycosylase [Bdellovibrionales bacterium]|nr:lytic murein transglycosylase [Bdellovibrionales bacterium]
MKYKVIFFSFMLVTQSLLAVEFDSTRFDQALKSLETNINCASCKKEHVHLIKKAKMNERAIELKFLNILESGPSTNRLLEYTTPASIQKVEDFMKEHHDGLCHAYQKTNVDPTVVTALMYMETLFGSDAIPWFGAMDSIVSLAALEDEKFASHVIEVLTPKMKIYKRYRENPTKWNNYDWNARAKWIAADWKKHLQAYLLIADLQRWPKQKVLDMKSSWAGAIGYSQFMPATALPYIKEQKAIDFWQWPDSFLLTSMYLQDEGFSNDTQKALEAYNSPKWYRDTILHLSHIMRHKHPDFCLPKKTT